MRGLSDIEIYGCAFPQHTPLTGYRKRCRCHRCVAAQRACEAATRTRRNSQRTEIWMRAERVKRWLMAAGYKYTDIDGATTALARLHVCGPERAVAAYRLATKAGKPSQSRLQEAVRSLAA